MTTGESCRREAFEHWMGDDLVALLAAVTLEAGLKAHVVAGVQARAPLQRFGVDVVQRR